MLLRGKDFQGCQLDARDGRIGKVKDLLFDDESWSIRYVVANTSRWLPGRRVLLSPASFVAGALDHSKLPVNLTKAQIRQSPESDTDQPVSEQYQRDIHAYYGWPAYWTTGPFPMAGVMPLAGSVPAPAAAGVPPTATGGDPHLRSAEHVAGYKIHAVDGTIGHVEDFIVDVMDWRIRGIVIDTRDWLPGRKVVVPAAAVDRISWTDSEVAVHLTRRAVEHGPELTADADVTGDLGQRLASYDQHATAGR
jgi:sporulation protein YlmC with PRC-barrel domain